MRKSSSRSGMPAGSRRPAVISLNDLNARAGRVGGVAFGAPGPRIDMDRVVESWRNGVSTGGSAQETPTQPARERTVSLADGTTISFTSARAEQPAD